jgi:hypothetical protein
MLQINPFLDCTVYSRIIVHIVQNNHMVKANILKWITLFLWATGIKVNIF